MNAWNRRSALGGAPAGVLLLGTLAGRGSSSNSSASVSGASGDATLVVYSSQGYDSAVTKAFTRATGIPVSLDDDSTGPLLAKVADERNNPRWGLLWVDGCIQALAGPLARLAAASRGRAPRLLCVRLS